MSIDMVVDLQYGSTGKGLIAGYLAKRKRHDTVVTANMPNAGHTFIDGTTGRKWVHKVLPNGIVSPGLKNVMIGPGAVFDIDRLKQEVEWSKDLLETAVLYIHEASGVLQEHHSLAERADLRGIASTMQGSAAALMEKMSRKPGSRILARHFEDEILDELSDYMDVYVIGNREWASVVGSSKQVLAEGAQGYSLGISSGFWPYCTSRDCTPARFMADMMLPLDRKLHVCGTARTFPIRVGNIEGGTSGPHYEDQQELTWSEVGQVPETTTVTGRIRRVFSFSMEQMSEAAAVMAPDTIFLNFANYMSSREDPDAILKLCDRIEMMTGVPVRYIGWGATDTDITEGRSQWL